MLRFLSAVFLTLLSALPLRAEWDQHQIPNLINYQGRLTDVQGKPVNGIVEMSVRVYDAPTGGNLVYEESIGSVEVVNGTYSFQFGDAANGIIGILVGFQCHLALVVDGVEEQTRSRLLAVPYALNAKQSETSADAQWLIQEQRRVQIEPTEIFFEPVTPGGNNTQTFSIANVGFRPISLLGANITGDWNDVQETFVVDPPGGNIAPGQSLNMTVTFAPGPDAQIRSDYVATLTLLSDITAGPTAILLKGAVVPPQTVLENDVAVSNISGEEGSISFWRFEVPSYATSLRFETSGGEGDVDLYLTYGELPNWNNIDHYSAIDGNNESILLENPASGSWFAMLYGYNLYSGITFLAKYEGTPELMNMEGDQDIINY